MWCRIQWRTADGYTDQPIQSLSLTSSWSFSTWFLICHWKSDIERRAGDERLPSRTDGRAIRRSLNERTRSDTRHKMRLVCVLFTFQNNTGQTDGRTDTTSYRDVTALLKRNARVWPAVYWVFRADLEMIYWCHRNSISQMFKEKANLSVTKPVYWIQ